MRVRPQRVGAQAWLRIRRAARAPGAEGRRLSAARDPGTPRDPGWPPGPGTPPDPGEPPGLAPPDEHHSYELWRSRWRRRGFELYGPTSPQLARAWLRRRPNDEPRATLRLPRGRAATTIDLDGRALQVVRAPRLGPWQLTDAQGEVVASVTKPRRVSERVQVAWSDRRLELRRRPGFGRPEFAIHDPQLGVPVGDPAEGKVLGSPTDDQRVGTIRRARPSGALHTLRLPAEVPVEVVALLAWWVAVLLERELAARTGR